MDCRRSNLREASQSQKQAGIVPAKRHATSRFKGVSKRRNGWIAQIMHNRRNTFLGVYGNEEDAARAYDKKALEIHGELAVTNETLGLYGPGKDNRGGTAIRPVRAEHRAGV